MKFTIPCLTSFMLAAAITPRVIRPATACNGVGMPGRWRHEETTPLRGGVAFFAGGLPFLFMGIAVLLAGNVTPALVCFAFVGAHAAFRRYNFQNARAGRLKILRPIGTDTGQVAPPRYSNPGTAREG